MVPLRPKYGWRERGIAIVEFAIALPLLLVLMFVTAELGRLLSQYDTLAKSVRDGARYAASKAAVGTTRVVSITPLLATETTNLVVTGLASGTGSPLLPGLSASNVSVTDAGNGYVSVAAAYTYQPMLGTNIPLLELFGSPTSFAFPLSATVIMRAL